MGDYKFQVLEPPIPPMWVIACALASFWEDRYPDMATIHLNELYTEAQLTNIFMIGRGSLNRALEDLQREGMLEVFRVAPPYQVALLNRDLEFYLEKMYGRDIDS